MHPYKKVHTHGRGQEYVFFHSTDEASETLAVVTLLYLKENAELIS